MIRQRLSVLLVCLAVLCGCATTPEGARLELERLNRPYSEEGFLRSAREGDSRSAALYLRAGMDPNTADRHGVTVLMMAAASGDLRSVKMLLAAGANPQVRNEAGWTALTYAERHGQTEVANLLREAGAGGSQQEFRDELARQGITFNPDQFLAVARRRPDLILTYVAAGANPEARDSDGVTALMLAAAADRPEVVRGLLSLGVDVNARDVRGWTALTYAEVRGARRVVELLRQAGAVGGAYEASAAEDILSPAGR
ncbi:MAG TPA: ankyrin repeat domain-containing protein [Symbiobacteriaceae bacterium]